MSERGLRHAYSSVGSPIGRGGGIFRVWNEIKLLHIEVGEGIEERRWGLRSAYSSVGAPVGRGGYEAAHHV